MCQSRIIVDNMLKYKEKIGQKDNETGDIITNFAANYLITRTKYPDYEADNPIIGIRRLA